MFRRWQLRCDRFVYLILMFEQTDSLDLKFGFGIILGRYRADTWVDPYAMPVKKIYGVNHEYENRTLSKKVT